MSVPGPPDCGYSADPHQCTATDRQRHAGDEIGFVGSEKQRCIRDVPCCSHPATQRNLGIALRSDLGAAAVACPSARVDSHWVSPGKMQLARMPYGAFCRASCSVKAIIAALVAL